MLSLTGRADAYLNVPLDNANQFAQTSRDIAAMSKLPETDIATSKNTTCRTAAGCMVAEMSPLGNYSWSPTALEPATKKPPADPRRPRPGQHLTTVRNTFAHTEAVESLFLMRPVCGKQRWHRLWRSRPRPAPVYIPRALHLPLATVEPGSNWKDATKALLAGHPTGALAAMGFPAGWALRPLWL